jgi:hypothetical protein
MKTVLVFFLLNFILFSHLTLAQSSQLSSDEIKKIQSISRALLNSRRKSRDLIEKKVQPLRRDVEEIKSLLLMAKSSLEVSGPSYIKKDDRGQVDDGDSGADLSKEISNLWDGSIMDDETLKGIVVSNAVRELILEAELLAVRRRSVISNMLPKFYQFWKDEDVRVVELDAVFSRLEAKIEEASISEHPISIIEDVLTMLTKNVSQGVKSQPTITTITKHYVMGGK